MVGFIVERLTRAIDIEEGFRKLIIIDNLKLIAIYGRKVMEQDREYKVNELRIAIYEFKIVVLKELLSFVNKFKRS
jgi:hypothetical protein